MTGNLYYRPQPFTTILIFESVIYHIHGFHECPLLDSIRTYDLYTKPFSPHKCIICYGHPLDRNRNIHPKHIPGKEAAFFPKDVFGNKNPTNTIPG